MKPIRVTIEADGLTEPLVITCEAGASEVSVGSGPDLFRVAGEVGKTIARHLWALAFCVLAGTVGAVAQDIDRREKDRAPGSA